MMMMNSLCGMVDQRKVLSLISSRDHCQRSSPSRISDTSRAGFELAENLSSGIVERSKIKDYQRVIVIIITVIYHLANLEIYANCFIDNVKLNLD